MASGSTLTSFALTAVGIQDFLAKDLHTMSKSHSGSPWRRFWAVLFKIWSFFVYLFQRQYRHVRSEYLRLNLRINTYSLHELMRELSEIQEHQTVRYSVSPMSSITAQRLLAVKPKILVLDLDETLIHSTHDGIIRPNSRTGSRTPDFILKVLIERHPVSFFVHKRPHVEFFLQTVSQWFELVIFTASMEVYGSAVSDRLDGGKNILCRRYFRQHCTQESVGYTKDLSSISPDLSSIFIIDNSPIAYKGFVNNALPISSWYCDAKDTALLDLLPFLDALRFVRDVRTVLSRHKSMSLTSLPKSPSKINFGS